MTGSLGSIFDGDDAQPSAPRGPTLRAEASVPQVAAGHEGGVWVAVPDFFQHDGKQVARARGEGEPPGCVRVFLPEGMRSGATLRLRGQGGVLDGGPPGELLVTLRFEDRAPRAGELGSAGSPSDGQAATSLPVRWRAASRGDRVTAIVVFLVIVATVATLAWLSMR